MESINIVETRNPSEISNSNSGLKKVFVEKFFSSLVGGTLKIIEGDTELVFGDKGNEFGAIEATIVVHDPAFYSKIYQSGSIGAGEAYMMGLWDSPSLVEVVRLFSRNIDNLQVFDSRGFVFRKIRDWMYLFSSRNTRKGARKNISAHYDLSNKFFSKFLSDDMMYSSAMFFGEDISLEEASLKKLETVCKKLQLDKNDHLLEIGSGWGGMAVYAAKNYGCRVTTTTISRQQYNHVLKLVEEQGLAEKVQVLNQDYRELQGSFDKIVSIEMIEAVGFEHYKDYFVQCNRLLKSDGLMLMQAITVPNYRFSDAKKSIDFIKKYIFPGGCLPCNEVIEESLRKHTAMQNIGMQDITWDYAKTLSIWRDRFLKQKNDFIKEGFSKEFTRMWDFYLAYCEGGFLERAIGTVQYIFAKNNFRF